MSVLLVTDDDADDEISPYEYLYQQLNVTCSSSSSHLTYSLLISIDQYSSSTNFAGQTSCRERRRRSRQQSCLVKSLWIYMFTLLFLTNHLHWSILFLSFSSIQIHSTLALDQQCRLINRNDIDRLCSKTCQPLNSPFERSTSTSIELDSLFLPFCSIYLLNQSINRTFLVNETSEQQCRQTFEQLMNWDNEARQASSLFAAYMQAIDSGSKENRYAMSNSECQEAYRTWTCSVNIPFYYRSQLIPPCQTICDEVERVCPTLRPSDREPLFAGQPLFFCGGGIVANSDYAQRPHCFDSCHLAGGSLQRHSVSSSDTSSISSVAQVLEDMILTPTCFEIQPYPTESLNQTSTPFDSLFSLNDSQLNHTLIVSSSSTPTPSTIIILICFILIDSQRRNPSRTNFDYT